MEVLPSGELQLTENYMPVVVAMRALESWRESVNEPDPKYSILSSELPPYAAAVVRPSLCT